MSNDPDITHSKLTRRAALLGGAQLGIAGVLGWRMYDLGVRDSEQYRLLAEENRVNLRLSVLDKAAMFAPFVEVMTEEKLPWSSTTAPHSFARYPETPEKLQALMEDYAGA